MSFEPSDFQLADAVREQREARPESSVKFLHKVIKLKYPNWTLSETRLKKFIRSNPATEQQELPPNITSSSKAPNPPSAIASLDSATRAANFVSASLPGGAVATATEDRGKRPSQVPALSLPTPPTAGFAVVEELIASCKNFTDDSGRASRCSRTASASWKSDGSNDMFKIDALRGEALGPQYHLF